jgi:hypothetical protein
MKSFAAIAGVLLMVACSQELPTSPSQATQKAPPPVSDAISGGRRRAVSHPAGCVDLSGVYDVRYESGCPASGYLTTWELHQNGCEFSASVHADSPSVRGRVSGSTVNLSLRNGFTRCTYSLDGTGAVANGVIRATVSGPTDGPCCGAAIDTVSLVATKR